TAFVSYIRLTDLSMSYANAGHNMPLVRLAPHGEDSLANFKVLMARGPRLGDTDSDRFEERNIQLPVGALIFWYTDGVLDCVNEHGKNFGKKRVMEILAEYSPQSCTMVRDALVDEIMRFTGGVRPPDDI